jgi:hypothetical protein
VTAAPGTTGAAPASAGGNNQGRFAGLKMPSAMRATLEQLDQLAIAELVAQKKLEFAAHRDAVNMLRWGAMALAKLSAEVAHHEPTQLTHRLLELLAMAACQLRDGYATRLQNSRERTET